MSAQAAAFKAEGVKRDAIGGAVVFEEASVSGLAKEYRVPVG
ncbi:hypothetical protein GCM10027187_72020 [Streptosporangium sandarakinum]|uniref:Uncharacterized protein n=1 Tax=Streptosporangium sandarakinum TaxID=1260955 RepID=A0A852USV8_9ACTN|nr:hypothetical protein [Streptosporangium sandarakinum]NYF38566.1 hypothetical protein [Streptosporangium sandarakinum]